MLSRLQRALSYSFRRTDLLRAALTHSSYANERQEGLDHNERLEFLGDAVLELCISEELYRRFPDTREGRLTAMRSSLVKQQTLAGLARKVGLPEVLALGKGEESQGGRDRDSLLSDALEAVLGAVYLDGGFDAARGVVSVLFLPLWPRLEERKKARDNKSLLQEITQERFRERPVYSLERSFGPEHARIFEIRLELSGGICFRAGGSSVKRAEQAAAGMALAALAPGGGNLDKDLPDSAGGSGEAMVRKRGSEQILEG
ncbi:MAG: ribonuclease III [Desulfovibrio sp.]|nr:ribonuclease III [Desulfovibrio sp.]